MQEGNQRERDGISLKKAEKTASRGKPEFLTVLKGLSYNERKGSGGESMIAVWIVAASFTIVGFLYGAPRLYKIIACKGRTTGRLLDARSASGTGTQPAKAKYEYYVDGKRYVGNTGWTNYGIFRFGQEYKVRYNPRKPQDSFINRSGMYINCILGIVFFLVGIGCFVIGGILLTIL